MKHEIDDNLLALSIYLYIYIYIYIYIYNTSINNNNTNNLFSYFRILGPIIFTLYAVLMYFITMNMFLAIIGDAYAKVFSVVVVVVVVK